ncbi:hypothetical protein HID58_084691, partial [Brassica napus]
MAWNTIERYHTYRNDHETSIQYSEIYIQQLKQEASHMIAKIELLEFHKRQLQRSLGEVRARKAQMFKEQLEKQKAKGKQLLEENVQLHQKNVIDPWRGSIDQQKKFRVIDLN